MKDPVKLQQKLVGLLKSAPKLQLNLPMNAPWTELELREAAFVVQDYVNRNDSVIESDDPFREWLEKYMFFDAERKGR